ncbi:hypothetical protein PSM36_1570 [Proteiniphilum saccharofermentans]|uniref:Secreted protein n=1 Tax=Proteiniphilum saccharofermentans TaxID=1642647 RepID=A0A1R3SZR0_9BACT|nr:hypothetical protein [Proteiniphilum saccharofermentans]SCD20390.1 hypothetical protein PSM36_1570 [Proteiniphilum saccharofermentans]
MRKYIFLILALFSSGLLQAQFTVSYSGGYSSYDTGAMRSMIRSVLGRPPASIIGAKNVDNFPAQNMIHVIDIGYLFEQHEFGLKGGGYHSTGGKLSLKDYSGEYANRFIVNGVRAGIYYKYYFFTYENRRGRELFSFFGEVSPGMFMTQFKNRGFFMVNGEELDNFDEMFNTSGFSFLTQIGTKYYITEKINIHVSVGYDFVAKAEWGESAYNSASINWSGIRFTGGVGFSF